LEVDMFGTSRKKLEKQQYEAVMQQLKAQQEMEVRMLQRQAQLQANMTTADYRGQYNTAMNALGQSVSSDTSTILRNVQGDIREMRNEMIMLRGFYEWMIHAYPETIAQYKALMDLQRAASNNETVAGQNAERASY
jgi:Tfp pilus assembly protein FimV